MLEDRYDDMKMRFETDRDQMMKITEAETQINSTITSKLIKQLEIAHSCIR